MRSKSPTPFEMILEASYPENSNGWVQSEIWQSESSENIRARTTGLDEDAVGVK